MKKRLFSLVLVLCLIIGLLPTYVCAATVVDSGTCGANQGNVKWTIYDDGLVYLTGRGDTVDLDKFQTMPWQHHNIERIVIEEGIEYIGKYFFNYCCRNATSITIPSSIKTMASNATATMSSLEEVHINDLSNWCSISFREFESNPLENMADLYLNGQLLEEVMIPTDITKISGSAFFGCTSLKKVVIPENIESVGRYAFHLCQNLTEVYFLGDAPVLGQHAFSATPATIYYPADNSTWTQEYLALFGEEIACIPFESLENRPTEPAPTEPTPTEPPAASPDRSGNLGSNGSWTLSSGVLTISGNGILTHDDGYAPWLDFPEEVQSAIIEEGITGSEFPLFPDCYNMTQVSLPSTMQTIPESAFAGCSSLTSIAIPEGVASMGAQAFLSCTGLIEVNLPSTLQTISEDMFNGCSSLTSITVPEGVTSIGTYAFANCSSLTEVNLPSTLTTISYYVFRNCAALTSIVVPEGVITMDYTVFDRCPNLRSVYIPLSMQSMCVEWVRECELTHIYYPGTQEQWDAIELYSGDLLVGQPNPSLANSTFHFNYVLPAFNDVVLGSFYIDAVAWAVENGITNGRTETTFAPGDSCKRSEVVTFLHRSQGKPVPGTVQSEFTDVQIGKFYTDAVAWAVENNITNGMGDGTFGVNQNCTRAQVVTFLWRTAGCPAPESTECEFTDVKPGAFYYDAVLWAVENGITNGMGDGTFGVGGTCTRGQIVTFLYRFAG